MFYSVVHSSVTAMDLDLAKARAKPKSEPGLHHDQGTGLGAQPPRFKPILIWDISIASREYISPNHVSSM